MRSTNVGDNPRRVGTRQPRPPTGKGRWSKAELRLLRRLAGNAPIGRIAYELGRSALAIRWQAKKLKLSLSWERHNGVD